MTTTKNKKQQTPLQRLRQEKRRLKAMYTEDEKRLAEDWEYLTDNIGSLAFNSIVKDAFFPALLKTGGESSGKSGVHGILNTLTASMPLIWEIVQPMLMGYLIKKIKNIFSSKKKRKEKASKDQ